MTRKKPIAARNEPIAARKGNAHSRVARHSHFRDESRIDSGATGILELHPKGYGFLRSLERNLARSSQDVYVPQSLIVEYGLQEGAFVTGQVAQQRGAGARLVKITAIESQQPRGHRDRMNFDELTPKNPDEWLRLEHADGPMAMRVIDLLCPIGKGQRALIAAPPRAGKTTLLKQIGTSISKNHPDVELKALLIDERPEEVTEIKSELAGQVFASCIDQSIESHTRLSQFVIQHCKRLAESGKDVFLLVDSLTRMARAFNKCRHLTGNVGAGGLNIRALDQPKNIFASARKFVEGGSLTIVATVLIDTKNRMDDVIHREFKGTGNLDMVLDQTMAERRIWPAIEMGSTGTRRHELIHDSDTYRVATALRRTLSTMHPLSAMSQLLEQVGRFSTNDAFVKAIAAKLDQTS